MNERIQQLAEQANEWASKEESWKAHSQLFTEKFAELIVRECALIAGLMEHEGRKNIGAQILDNFGIAQSNIEIAERIHSDKGYSIGTPEAQEAFDSKRGYKL